MCYGPEPSDPVHAQGMNIWMRLNGFHWNMNRLGEEGSLAFIGPEWAASLSSPHSLYKFYASEGGIKAPLIVSGPGVLPGARSRALTHVTDVAPTLLELAQAPLHPEMGDVEIAGQSLASILRDGAPGVRGPDDVIGTEVSGNAALFQGAHKIVRNMPPMGDGRWRLYNLERDPGETRDLAQADPQRLSAMVAAYEAYAADNGVLALPPGYQVERQVLHNGLARQLWYNTPWLVLLTLSALCTVAFAWARRARRARKETSADA